MLQAPIIAQESPGHCPFALRVHELASHQRRYLWGKNKKKTTEEDEYKKRENGTEGAFA
jgi:hypothetical protein